MKLKPKKPLIIVTAIVTTVFAASMAAIADEKKASLSGTWHWSSEGFRGQPMEATLTLVHENDALSGNYDGAFGESEIEEAKAETGAISFKITRKFGDREMTSAFEGKLDGKLLKGTVKLEGLDQPLTANWQAYRAPEIDPSGLWKWSTSSERDGSKREHWVKFEYGAEGLSGLYKTARGQIPIAEAVLDGRQVSFKVERRWRGDRSFLTAYKGTLEDKAINGSITSRRGDEDRSVAWAASPDISDVDPIGSWSWKRSGRNGEERESKITITRDGEKLTGTVSGRGGESSIEDARLEGDVLSFKVTRENDRGSFTSTYSGKIDGDVFDASAATKFGERTWKRRITATRTFPAGKPEGTWKWASRRGRGGESVENALTLKLADDGTISGTIARGERESAIEAAKFDGNQISFSVRRTFGDNEMTFHYHAQVRDSVLKGGYSVGGSGESDAPRWESYWEAKRAE